MAQYIDKSALVAELEKRRSRNSKNKLNLAAAFEDNYLLSFIDTLEVKDIEDLQGLEKEVAKGKNILIIKKILLRFFESANANDEEFSKAIEDIENGLI